MTDKREPTTEELLAIGQANLGQGLEYDRGEVRLAQEIAILQHEIERLQGITDEREEDRSVITSCGDCDLFEHRWEECRHPVGSIGESWERHESYKEKTPPPKNCPLRERQLVISFGGE